MNIRHFAALKFDLNTLFIGSMIGFIEFMNRNSLIATIQSQCHDLLKEATLADGASCKYLPIFSSLAKECVIAITENGYWCSVFNRSIREVRGPDHGRVLFSLLEMPLSEMVITIKKGINENRLPEIAILTFPFDEILVASLQSNWADLALKWIEQGYPLNDEMRLILCGNDKQNKIWLKAQKSRLSKVLCI